MSEAELTAERNRLRHRVADLEMENAHLRRWKDEALQVLDGWEQAWHAIGSPGHLGVSKSEATVTRFRALRVALTVSEQELVEVRAELAAARAEQRP